MNIFYLCKISFLFAAGQPMIHVCESDADFCGDRSNHSITSQDRSAGTFALARRECKFLIYTGKYCVFRQFYVSSVYSFPKETLKEAWDASLQSPSTRWTIFSKYSISIMPLKTAQGVLQVNIITGIDGTNVWSCIWYWKCQKQYLCRRNTFFCKGNGDDYDYDNDYSNNNNKSPYCV